MTTDSPLSDMLEAGRVEFVPTPTPRDWRLLYAVGVFLFAVLCVLTVADLVKSAQSQATARACVAVGGDWQITDGGDRICVGTER